MLPYVAQAHSDSLWLNPARLQQETQPSGSITKHQHPQSFEQACSASFGFTTPQGWYPGLLPKLALTLSLGNVLLPNSLKEAWKRWHHSSTGVASSSILDHLIAGVAVVSHCFTQGLSCFPRFSDLQVDFGSRSVGYRELSKHLVIGRASHFLEIGARSPRPLPCTVIHSRRDPSGLLWFAVSCHGQDDVFSA